MQKRLYHMHVHFRIVSKVGLPTMYTMYGSAAPNVSLLAIIPGYLQLYACEISLAFYVRVL